MNKQKICIIGDGLAGLTTAAILSQQNICIDLYSNGKIKEQGEMRYNKAEFDYEKIGTWMFYNESGKVMKGPSYFKPDLNKFLK